MVAKTGKRKNITVKFSDSVSGIHSIDMNVFDLRAQHAQNFSQHAGRIPHAESVKHYMKLIL